MLRSWIARGDVRAPRSVPVRVGALGIVLLVGAAVAYDAGKFRFVRSEAAVRLGWVVGQSHAAGIAAEQSWRFGGHLYLDASAPMHRPRSAGCRRRAAAARCGVPAGRAVGSPPASPAAGGDDRRLERLRVGAGPHGHRRRLPAVPQAVLNTRTRQKETAGAPCGAPAGGTCERRPRRAVVGTRQNVTRVTICRVRGAATPLIAPKPSGARSRWLVAEVGDRRVGEAREVRRGVDAGELRVVERVERVDAELELQALRTARRSSRSRGRGC